MNRPIPCEIISTTGLVREVARLGGRASGATVEGIMTPYPFALPDSAPLSQALALMVFEGVSQLPIVDARGQVVGVLTTLDVMRWLIEQGGCSERAPDRGRSDASAADRIG